MRETGENNDRDYDFVAAPCTRRPLRKASRALRSTPSQLERERLALLAGDEETGSEERPVASDDEGTVSKRDNSTRRPIDRDRKKERERKRKR